MKKLTITFILLLTTLFGALPLGVHADEGNVGFSVRAVLPDNQVNSDVTYFDLRMTPSQQQTIQVEVINDSSEETTFDVNVNQAYTNQNGFIDYEKPDGVFDESLKYPINDVVKYEKEVTVPAKASKLVDVEITMPAEEYDGQILAGIQVVKDPNRGEDTTGQITNLFAYVIGLRLTETDVAVQRELKVDGVSGDVAFGTSAVVATMINPTMDAIGKLNYEGIVYQKGKKDSTTEEFSYVGKEMSMAPNSVYDFAIDLGKNEMASGDYVLELQVSDAKDNVWNFTEEFTVTAKEAKAINQIVIPTAPNGGMPGWFAIVAGVAAGLVVFGLLLLALRKRKKATPENNGVEAIES